MASTLSLSDGTVTADLRNPSGDLHVLWGQWAPQVARPRPGFMGGNSPFLEVVEELGLRIDGADVDDILGTNLVKLMALIYQAQRWRDGDKVDPVIFSYQPTNSTLADPVKALIEGYADQGVVAAFGGDFDRLKNNLSLLPSTFRFKRRGQWLGPLETPSASSAADNPVVQVATFASEATIPSPVDIVITGFTDDSHLTINPGVILASNAASKIELVEAAGMTATGFTTVDDSTKDAVGDDVLRYTPSSTAEAVSGSFDLTATSFDTDAERVAVFASVRVNASSKVFSLRAEGTSYLFGDKAATEIQELASADYVNPTWIQLGWLHLRKGLKSLRLVASVDSTSASPTLDIDELALLVVDSNSYVIRHETAYLSSPFIPDSESPVPVFLKVEPRALSDRTPFVGYTESLNNTEAALGHDGDPAVYMTGSALAVLWLSTNADKWRDTNQSTGDVTEVQLAGFRRTAYLNPR